MTISDIRPRWLRRAVMALNVAYRFCGACGLSVISSVISMADGLGQHWRSHLIPEWRGFLRNVKRNWREA